MAQKQYTTYQADILSFELRDAMLGILNSGRYCGFDEMVENGSQAGNDIPVRIQSTTGVDKFGKEATPVLEANRAVLISKQGTIIADDGTIDITVTIQDPGETVYHIVYMEHVYTEVPGANNATYGIIHGAETGDPPALSSPTKRIIVGIITEAESSTQFSDLRWYPFYPG